MTLSAKTKAALGRLVWGGGTILMIRTLSRADPATIANQLEALDQFDVFALQEVHCAVSSRFARPRISVNSKGLAADFSQRQGIGQDLDGK